MAARLLAWRYQKLNMSLPAASELEMQARQLVDDAHRIAKERGKNVVGILKDLVEDIKKK